jgi:hypothetical protein
MAVSAQSPTRARRVRSAERDRHALELRIQGCTFAEIGAELGVTLQAAHFAVKRSMARTQEDIAERAGELRAIESAKLDAAAAVLWPKVLEGDLRAHDRWLRNRESYRRLCGLDLMKAPDVTVQGPTIIVGGEVFGANGATADTIDGEATELPALPAPPAEPSISRAQVGEEAI